MNFFFFNPNRLESFCLVGNWQLNLNASSLFCFLLFRHFILVIVLKELFCSKFRLVMSPL